MDSRLVVVVGYPDAELLDIACITTSLVDRQRLRAGPPPYEVVVATPGGQPIACRPGLTLQSQHALEQLEGLSRHLGRVRWPRLRGSCRDPQCRPHPPARPSLATDRIRLHRRHVLATLRLARRTPRHHPLGLRAAMAARHQRVIVDPDPIYIRDGNVITAAGVTSALDLALAFIEEDHGVRHSPPRRPRAGDLCAAARQPGAGEHVRRPGSAASIASSAASSTTSRATSTPISARLRWPASPASATAISLASSSMTVARHPAGSFGRRAPKPPPSSSPRTSLPVSRVAGRCGFGSPEALRQAFVARFQTSPSRYRLTHSRRAARV